MAHSAAKHKTLNISRCEAAIDLKMPFLQSKFLRNLSWSRSIFGPNQRSTFTKGLLKTYKDQLQMAISRSVKPQSPRSMADLIQAHELKEVCSCDFGSKWLIPCVKTKDWISRAVKPQSTWKCLFWHLSFWEIWVGRDRFLAKMKVS